MDSLVLNLKDGRKLGYAEYGDRSGVPVLFFHGTPGSRLLFLDDDPACISLGIRLISLDRPGFGLSDPKPGRTLLDWTDDVREAADLLGLKKFSVIGVSGGGAYAAACAYRIPERLHSAALVSSIAPFADGKPPKSMSRGNRIAFFLSRKWPGVLKANYRAQKKLISKRPEAFKRSLLAEGKRMNEWDRRFLRTDEQLESFILHLGEAMRSSVDECANEPALIAKPWGFQWSDMKGPIDIWHGEIDTMAPASEIRKLAPSLADCKARYVAGAGHFLTDDEVIWRDILSAIRERVQ
ncbi:alpha/beta fold hydrolase [Cohnella thailandensis]|uniref:Alpha/beta hydrolase n=1 Tax=Cohnella thailandensis TaxID=557557 RepID=A0A841SPD8_9BACL|nr:alpha/beta hydrolase [Cohnella thailandensis]MBB6633062.1 alpha/beta hydrolase [Cohnella thailandensis]MBP1975243.1 pimeloyl-ACP methyl ester carboxylesterase [Cohnella thailandensis]